MLETLDGNCCENDSRFTDLEARIKQMATINDSEILKKNHNRMLQLLHWTRLTLLNGFSFLVYFFFFILGCAVD